MNSQVLKYDPDLVFIEFSCNDGLRYTEDPKKCSAKTRAYLESMIRQCMEAEKVPSIIYMHTPIPVDPDTDGYVHYRKGCQLKDDVLNYYGIGVIDIMQDVVKDYRAKLEESIRELLNGASYDETRLLTETAIFADRLK